MAELTILIPDDEVDQLQELVGDGTFAAARTVTELIEYLAHAAADGVRRPGSWERGWIQQATGWGGGFGA